MKKATLDGHTSCIPDELLLLCPHFRSRDGQPTAVLILPRIGVFPCTCKLLHVVHSLQILLMSVTSVLYGVPRDFGHIPR